MALNRQHDYAVIHLVGVNGGTAKVDVPDLPIIAKYGPWRLGGHGYVTCKKPGTDGHKQLLHRVILGVAENQLVTALNGDYTDCRRQNLAIHVVNHTKRGTNPGVSFDRQRNKWRALACKSGKRVYLGRFDTKEEAEKARNEYVKAVSKASR